VGVVADSFVIVPNTNNTRRNMRKSVLAGLAIAALTLTGCAAAEEVAEPVEEVMVEEAPMEETPEVVEEAPGTIVDVAVAAGTFTTLAAALDAAGLVETLQGEGPFTVFAPTDDAFAALPEGVLDALLLPDVLPPQDAREDEGAGAFGSRPFVWSLVRR
jgi:uncharacterized surface protein with fasciclin (FAS1) repeats